MAERIDEERCSPSRRHGSSTRAKVRDVARWRRMGKLTRRETTEARSDRGGKPPSTESATMARSDRPPSVCHDAVRGLARQAAKASCIHLPRSRRPTARARAVFLSVLPECRRESRRDWNRCLFLPASWVAPRDAHASTPRPERARRDERQLASRGSRAIRGKRAARYCGFCRLSLAATCRVVGSSICRPRAASSTGVGYPSTPVHRRRLRTDVAHASWGRRAAQPAEPAEPTSSMGQTCRCAQHPSIPRDEVTVQHRARAAHRRRERHLRRASGAGETSAGRRGRGA